MKDDKSPGSGDAATRLAELRSGKKPVESASEDELLEINESEEKAFSKVSADRMQKVMLVLWFKNGNAAAKPYSYMAGIDFNPSKEIVLDFVDSEVRITGRNLKPLFVALAAQRVQSIWEMDEVYVEAEGATAVTVVTRIEVKERKE
jgi:hypothetical protein